MNPSWLLANTSLSSGFFYNKNKTYLKEFIWPSKTISELQPSFISPSERITVSSFIRGNIKISSRTITDIVNKLVFGFFIEGVWVSSISGFGKVERFLFWLNGLFEVMDAIIRQETTINIVNI